MKPIAVLVVVAALVSGCADTPAPAPAPEPGKSAPAPDSATPAPPAPLPTAAKLPRVVYYVISEA